MLVHEMVMMQNLSHKTSGSISISRSGGCCLRFRHKIISKLYVYHFSVVICIDLVAKI